MYASHTLTTPERNYNAQLEEEGLALVWGIRKFHKYLYRRRFTTVTGHKPLLAILAIPGVQEGSTHVSSCETAAMGCVLMGYQYDVNYCSTTQHCIIIDTIAIVCMV